MSTQVLRSAGQPLDANTRAFMEPRFGLRLQRRARTCGIRPRHGRRAMYMRWHLQSETTLHSLPDSIRRKSYNSNRLLAHELAPRGPTREARDRTRSRQALFNAPANPAFIPPEFECDTDLSAGRLGGTDLLFGTNQSVIDNAVHDTDLTAFVDSWVAAGGTDDILIHGYASTSGDQALNWTLSCQRAQSVRDELVSRGIPLIHIDIVAHGESTDFGASLAANQHAVISTSPANFFSNPLILTFLTPKDDFAGRSHSRFGVGEEIRLDFFSVPPRPARDFGGLVWSRLRVVGTCAGLLIGALQFTRAVHGRHGPVRSQHFLGSQCRQGRSVSHD